MIVTPRTGETWLSRSTGEPVTITDSYATAIIGARVAHADAAGHRQNDGLISFRARYVPAVTRPHPLDRAIDGAIKTDLGLGVRTDQPDRMRLAVLTWCASIASSGGDIDDLIGVAAWAAAWVAALDLAGLPAATDAARRVHREEVLIYDCQVEYDRAAAKHAGITPYHPSMADVHRAAILIEEVGEVARALTPDAAAPTGHAGDLRAELVQVATMALAWAARILADTEETTR